MTTQLELEEAQGKRMASFDALRQVTTQVRILREVLSHMWSGPPEGYRVDWHRPRSLVETDLKVLVDKKTSLRFQYAAREAAVGRIRDAKGIRLEDERPVLFKWPRW